ncbi:MAG: hypothetical protein FJ020_10105 [Chloroflexi bacterium]|nr:hypothetical protein [Chloroflexota bacterium]
MNKTSKQRLSQAEIDSLVQQAAAKKQLGSGPRPSVPRPQKQEARPTPDSKRPPEANPAVDAAAAKPEGQRQPEAKTPEQARSQQAQAATAKKEASPAPEKAAETPAKVEEGRSRDEKAPTVVLVPTPGQQNPLELKQYFWLGGEGTSGLQPDGVMTVLNKKLIRLG